MKFIEEVKEHFEEVKESIEESTESIEEEVKKIYAESNKVVVKETIDASINKNKKLSKIFLDNIKNGNLNKDIKIVLTTEVTDIIIKIIDLSPDFLDDIEKPLLKIVKDNNIDSNDLPQLILLIQKLYQIIYSNKINKINSKKIPLVCGQILKFICHFLILDERIKINETHTVIVIELINKLIDSCVGLLSFPKNIKVKRCFSSLFGKK